MKNIDIIIQQSGLLERFNCKVADIVYSHSLYKQGFTYDIGNDIDFGFIEMLSIMRGDLKEINDVFREEIARTKDYLLECEIKKANGTFEEWQAELSSLAPMIDKFFVEFSKIVPSNKNTNRLN